MSDEKDADEAMIRLLTMNRLRGSFIPIKLAYVLADLATRIDEKTLRRRLGMEAGELKDSLRLATFTDDAGAKLREAAQRESKEAPTILRFVVSKRDGEAIERAVDLLMEGKIDRGMALARITREWERDRK